MVILYALSCTDIFLLLYQRTVFESCRGSFGYLVTQRTTSRYSSLGLGGLEIVGFFLVHCSTAKGDVLAQKVC